MHCRRAGYTCICTVPFLHHACICGTLQRISPLMHVPYRCRRPPHGVLCRRSVDGTCIVSQLSGGDFSLCLCRAARCLAWFIGEAASRAGAFPHMHFIGPRVWRGYMSYCNILWRHGDVSDGVRYGSAALVVFTVRMCSPADVPEAV
jgi:hypothetical protein